MTATDRQIVHVVPMFGREHATDHGADCWCEPEAVQPCPVCASDLTELHAALTRGAKRPKCVECGGRGVVGEFDMSAGLILVHSPRGEADAR